MPCPVSLTAISTWELTRSRTDLDLSAPGGEFHRVREEVPHDLLQALRVPRDPPRVRVEDDVEPDALGLGGRAHHVDRSLHHGREVHGADVEAEPSGHDARHVQQVLDELRLRPGAALDRLDGARRLLRVERFADAEQSRPGEDRRERRPELVRDRGEEGVLRAARRLGITSRAFGFREERFPLPLRPLPLGHVPRDLRGADDPSLRVADRRHGERDLDALTVLPDALGLEVLHALAPPNGREDGLQVVEALGRHETRDVLSDHLARRPAEEPLRRRVPARDDAVQGLRGDGVIRRLHERAQPRLHLFRLPPQRDVGARADPLADGPVGVQDGHRRGSHPEILAARLANATLDLDLGLLGEPAAPGGRGVLAIVGVDRGEPSLGRSIVGGPAGVRPPARRVLEDEASGIHRPHRLRARRHQGPEAPFAPAKVLPGPALLALALSRARRHVVGTPLGPAKGLPEGDDDGAGQEERERAHEIGKEVLSGRLPGHDEHEERPEEGQDRRRDRRPEAAVPHRERDRPEERDERKRSPEDRIEKRPRTQSGERRDGGYDVRTDGAAHRLACRQLLPRPSTAGALRHPCRIDGRPGRTRDCRMRSPSGVS